MQDSCTVLSVSYVHGRAVSAFQSRILMPFIAPPSCDKLDRTGRGPYLLQRFFSCHGRNCSVGRDIVIVILRYVLCLMPLLRP